MTPLLLLPPKTCGHYARAHKLEGLSARLDPATLNVQLDWALCPSLVEQGLSWQGSLCTLPFVRRQQPIGKVRHSCLS